MESSLIPNLGYPFVPMPIRGFRGVLSLSTVMLPLRILRSVRIAREAIRRHRADAVVCTGAYVSYPAGLAARQLGVPLFVLESNVNPGKTNARLARFATAVVLAFDESRALFPPSMAPRLHVLGNPVRTQIDAARPVAEARRSLGLDPSLPVVLVFGGSLGARTINEAMVAALPTLASAPFQVLWQTGAQFQPPAHLPPSVRTVPFIADMGSAYAAADLVVARSGATTIAELGLVAKPAILVPLGTASTNEQARNAAIVERIGGGVVRTDAAVGADLGPTMLALMGDAQRRTAMATAMATLGRPHAARDVARLMIATCRPELAR